MATRALGEAPAVDDDYTGTHHVYLPYRAGLPRLKPYLRELWRRREFMNAMSKASARADHLDTWFGRLWTLLDPLLMAGVYYLLVTILRGSSRADYFAYLLSGLFLFSVLQSTMGKGVRSIVKSGKMVNNTAFPRAMLPLAAVRSAINEFWPSLFLVAIIAGVSGARLHWAQLTLIPILAIYLVMCCGIAMLVATMQVYFRDTRIFIPYLARVWLYASPVLWLPSMIPAGMDWVKIVNPMYGIVSSWSLAIIEGTWPTPTAWISAIVWSLVIFFLGAYVFLSRERDFAVRI